MGSVSRVKSCLIVCLLVLVELGKGQLVGASSETGHYDNWDISVTRYEQRSAIESGSHASRGVYLLVYLNVRNRETFKYAITFSPANLRLADSTGRTFGPDLTGTFKVRDAEYFVQDVAVPSGGILRTVVVFDLPRDADDLSLTTAENTFSIRLSDGRLVSRGETTASPTAWQEPRADVSTAQLFVGDLTGFREGVGRTFVGFAKVPIGTALFIFSVFRFDSPETASSAKAELARRHSTVLFDDMTGIQRSYSSNLGDESLAYAGKIVAPGQSIEVDVGVVVTRRAALVRVSIAVAVTGDPIGDLIAVESKVIDRQPESAPVTFDENGLRVGGLWSALPRLGDLPDGFLRMQEVRYD